MTLIPTIAEKIARARGHDLSRCNDKCQCYPLALEIVALFEQSYADDRNRLSQMLMERTDELNRLKRLVGEEA